MKKNYYIFDLVKFILSLFIIQIHIGILQSYNPIVNDFLKNLIGRYAVPLFFCISSYLLFEKINKKNFFCKENLNIYINYLKRILILYLVWTLIYFIFFKFIFNYDFSYIYYLLSLLFSGFYVHFWFLHSLILGMIFFLFLLKIMDIKKILYISILLYAIGLILTTYNPIFTKLFNFIPIYTGNALLARNCLTFALIFITIGAYINLNKNKKTNKLKQKILFLSLLSIVEFIFLKYINSPYLALQVIILILTYYLFKFIQSIDLKEKKIYIRLRKYSTIIYCSHNLIYIILKKTIFINNSLIMYILTVLACILLSEIVIYLSKKGINLKFLY